MQLPQFAPVNLPRSFASFVAVSLPPTACGAGRYLLERSRSALIVGNT